MLRPVVCHTEETAGLFRSSPPSLPFTVKQLKTLSVYERIVVMDFHCSASELIMYLQLQKIQQSPFVLCLFSNTLSLHFKINARCGVVAYTCNPHTQEAEAGDHSQPGQSQILPPKKPKKARGLASTRKEFKKPVWTV